MDWARCVSGRNQVEPVALWAPRFDPENSCALARTRVVGLQAVHTAGPLQSWRFSALYNRFDVCYRPLYSNLSHVRTTRQSCQCSPLTTARVVISSTIGPLSVCRLGDQQRPHCAGALSWLLTTSSQALPKCCSRSSICSSVLAARGNVFISCCCLPTRTVFQLKFPPLPH
jgi:hypothetical protein